MQTHNIQFTELNEHIRVLQPEILKAVGEVLESTAFSGGSFVDRFEQEFAEYISSPYFVGVASGSDALMLALLALGIGPGDEVIVPANTFIATAFAAMRIGAVPVFVDVDPETWEIDPGSAERAVTPRTKAIIGVHLFGQAFPVNEIAAIAEKHGLRLLEDCAQAQGTLYYGKMAGTLSDAGCFSFYPTKNLGTCGQAGGIALKDPAADEVVRILRSQGSKIQYHHERRGYNMRLDSIQAAILSVMLPHLKTWNEKRAAVIERYRKEIVNPAFTFQKTLPYTEPAWYLAVVCVEDQKDFIEYMQKQGIYCGIHYPIPCHLQKAVKHLNYHEGDLPNAEYQASHCVSLPLYPELSAADVDRVIEACSKYHQ